MEPHYYHTQMEWDHERIGTLSSNDTAIRFSVATPPPFPKGIAGFWSPEHLLSAAVNSCFMTTFLAIAENSKLEFVKFSCSSKGKLEQVEGKYLITEISLLPELEIKNEHDRERAERILQKSEAACLISNSIKSKVTLQTNITCQSYV